MAKGVKGKNEIEAKHSDSRNHVLNPLSSMDRKNSGRAKFFP